MDQNCIQNIQFKEYREYKKLPICLICHKTFKNNQVLSRHISRHHCLNSQEYYDLYLKKANEGICPECGNKTTFRGLKTGYLEYCCSRCAKRSEKTRNKYTKTCLQKYGVTSYVYSDDFKRKTTQTNQAKYGNDWFIGSEIGKERLNKTNQARYGVNYPLENTLIKQKANQSQQDKYGDIYMRTNQFTTDSTHFYLLNYGVENYMQTAEFHQKSSETKRKNHTNNLQTETRCYNLLSRYVDVCRQYQSEKYPFLCDFYIHSFDLYVELNFFWTHGKYWFDDQCQADVSKLEFWKQKNSKYYNTAVEVWSKSDKQKKEIALQNKLNYVVLWNVQQFMQFVDDIRTHKLFIGFIDYNEEVSNGACISSND